ncbi:MAG: S8 family serine peptidase [Oscillospiraceae bacterium]|nr:S8 family serine peptidase [Oscillospiraceae bacterium]
MKKHLFNRLLSLVLAAVMVLGMFPAVSAAPAGLSWEKTDVDVSWDRTDRLAQDDLHDQTAHKPTDTVRVSIVLEDAPTVKAGYATMDIGSNAEALAYDLNLQKVQKTMEKTISVQALDGKALDVVWNLTLVSNIISANVPYGKIDAIKSVDGVKDVVIETLYETTEVEKNTYTSAGMVGATDVWQTGLTGAGSRVAIIDTGTDTDHQSFDNDAYLYALQQNADAKGMGYEEYVASLDLLDAEEIAAVLKNLNAYERIEEEDAASYYMTEKLPFGANYVDYNLNVTHDWDNQGSHGSHVAGIAAANRYIQKGSSFVAARDTVRMSGIAPDAQIITLKVFGYNPGPYDSDYFAAIEDAIWLGCDSVNLSLGSGAPGYSKNSLFADLLDYMATTDTVVVMSAGNSGNWAESTAPTYLYADGVSFQTNGSPGSYTNSLGVASVDNDGTVGKYIDVAGNMIVYTETEYSNLPIASLDTSADGTGTVYDYIFIDGIGNESDYAGMDLTGKVVFCHRGEISFSEKANNAAKLGAAAIVICNNVEEPFGMDLTDYEHTAPCVSVLMSDGAAVRAASTEQTTDAGLTYYTGKVTVSTELGATEYNSEYYTMSTFSSWGVPGSLEMKPEITAPGGLIWSVNGVATSGTEYELMSGTSMAAPQVTGMAALVAEYIKENGLDEQTGLSVRHLAQSLLMSTAEPLREGASGGEYYSILNQGSGLARIDLATTAESYVLVDGMPDGKVKVELGEDADRTGVYEFSFSIHNMNGEAMTYALSADLFTQDLFGDDYGNLYLDTWTTTLGADASFSMDGASLEIAGDDFSCDLNGDGVTTGADADYLLEYLVDNVSELKADGDVNGDGEVTSYDAHVLLTRLSGAYTVDVPANGSVTVDVKLELTEETKTLLDTYYTTGAYVEAFVFAEPVTDSEGKLGVTHSIPVLGYYGSWSEPSMYDVGSYVEYIYGTETRAPYLYAINNVRSNYVTINYGDGEEYLFGGNPLTEEADYLPERNAFNNKNGAVLQNLRFTQIRNADNAMLVVENAETGEVLISEELGYIDGAYYHTNLGQWQNTQYKLDLGLDFAGIGEGTRLNVSLISAPEYYCQYNEADELVGTDWEALAEGAYLTTTFTIDNTAPVIKNIELGEDNTLNITAKDNEYIAAVALMNASGTSILTADAANQTERGVEHTAALNLDYIFGSEFLVAVFDYAENVAVYAVTLELDNVRPYFTGIDRTNVNDDYSVSYVGMEADGTAVKLAAATGREPARAAEYVEGYIFEISNDNKLYVGSNEDLFNFTELGALDPNDEHQIVGFNDLAYNKADGKLYGLFYSRKNEQAVPFLCTIDMYTGALNVLGQMPIDANSMAIDGEGNFYSAIYGASQLYTYTSDVTKTGKAKFVGLMDDYTTTTLNSMAWDHNTDELYWAVTNDSITNLLKVDPKTAKTEFISYYGYVTVGLFIAYEAENDIFAPVNTVSSVVLPESASTLAGQSVQLTAKVLPWNVSNGAVTWTSSNPDVATVDETGMVYGMAEGTAVITATSVLDPSKSASCTVTVAALGKNLKGLVWDEEGQVHWASFNTDTIPAYESLNAITPNLPVNATMVVDGKLYASTLDTSSGLSDLYTVDPKTFEMTPAGGSPAIGYLDMTYAPSLGYGMGVYFNYIVLIDLENGDYYGAWDWTEGVTADLVGITYYGSAFNSNYSAYMDYFLILDADGNVYLDAFMSTGSAIGYFNGPEYGYIKTIGKPVDYSYFQGFHFDGEMTYWTRFNEEDNVVELIVWDCEDTDNVYSMGYFGEGVWPVGGLYTDAEINGTMALADEALTTASVKNAELLTSIDPVEMSGAKGSLNAVLNTKPAVRPMSKGDVTASGDVSVTVTVPADAATNGTAWVKFDPAALELAGAYGKTDAFAWRQVEDGKVMIAFADSDALAKDSVISVLSFHALTKGDTTVTVTWGEYGTEYLELFEEISLHICPSEHFVDVNPGDWWHEAVDYVVSAGYMNGMDATHYGPAATMNRAQFVTVLYRMEGEPTVNNTGVFTDVPADLFYTNAAYWALEKGITTGATADTFNPNGKLTRTELVTFMYRYAAYKDYDTETGDLSAYRDADQVLPFAVDAWSWAVEHGIITGMTVDTLAPMALTNRAQAAVIFQRFDTTFAG